MIPFPIQVGTAVGIGLLTALAGAIEIDLVKTGEYTIVTMGRITPEIIVAIAGTAIVGIALHFHAKAAFCIAMTFGTVVWWTYDNSWPTAVANVPSLDMINSFPLKDDKHVTLLTMDLLFLYILTLSGLVSSLSTLATLTRSDNTTPRNRWLFVVCGLCTVLSGLFSGPPILISPESASGIKAGARTGLSTIVCGLCFGVSVFFAPILKKVPHAATAPLLLAVGVVLFQNVHKLNWKVISDSMPAYFALFFIPFTYSILQGVALAYVVYIVIGIFTGDIFYSTLELYVFYFGVPFEKWRHVSSQSSVQESLLGENSAPSGVHSSDTPLVTHDHPERRAISPLREPLFSGDSTHTLIRQSSMSELDHGIAIDLGLPTGAATAEKPFLPNEESFLKFTAARRKTVSDFSPIV